jgi:DNA-binding LytR/AlgR family response regulator
MSTIKILIVEDELIIAEDIRMELEGLGYEVVGIAASYDEALDIFLSKHPDVMLVDILIAGEKDGIELALTIRKQEDVPLIFLTSHADKGTVERAKQAKPDAYLVKPFERADLFTAIEIAFFNYVNKKPRDTSDESIEEKNNFILKDSIFIKKDYLLIKVRFDEIRWFKAEGNYIELYCPGKKYLVRSSMREFLAKLPPAIFVQTHKSYAVNLDHIDSIDHSTVYIGKEEIPIGRTFLDQLKRILNIEL